MEKTAFEFDVFPSHIERDKPRVRKPAERLREVERGLEASRIDR